MPSEQEILVNFIGSSYRLMKELDGQIISSSSTLGRRSDDLKKVLTDVAINQQHPSVPQQVTQQPVVITQPLQQPTPQQQLPIQDDQQLWLDFKERDKIYDLLDTINEKQDLILKRLEKLENNYTISRKRGI